MRKDHDEGKSARVEAAATTLGRIRLWLLALLFLGNAVIACQGAAEETVTTTATTVPATMPAATATAGPAFEPDMAIFETVWQMVRDGFYDSNMNGVDWQEIHDLYQPRVAAAKDGISYYRVLNDMLFELGVSHIGLLPPEAADELDPITFPAGSLGFDVRLLEEQLVVTTVESESPAAEAGLQPGFIVMAVNGQTAAELAAETLQMPPLNERDRKGMITQAVRAELYGEPGQQVTVSFLDENDQASEVNLAYRRRLAKQTEITPDLPPAYVEFSSYRLTPDIGYLHFSGFQQGVDIDAAAAIDAMADTEALIIDLRGNPGGVFPVRKALAEKLVGEPILFWQYQQRDRLQKVYLEAMPTAYQGDVVILIDALSASSSEEFAGGLQAGRDVQLEAALVAARGG